MDDACHSLPSLAADAGGTDALCWRASVLMGRVYELRMLLHGPNSDLDRLLGFTEVSLTFHTASGATLDPRLDTSVPPVPHLAPLTVETLPSAPGSDALRAAGTASRFLVPPPDAVELRLSIETSEVVAVSIELAPLAVSWPDEGVAVERRVTEASHLRADLLRRHLPAGSCAPDVLARVAATPTEQVAAIRAQFARAGDWSATLARLTATDCGASEAVDFEERVARRATRRVEGAPRIAFVGSPRTHARLRCLADVVLLREAHWEAQLDALRPDRIVIETAAETVSRDWRHAFASLSGALSETGRALCEGARERGIPVCLLITAEPGEMSIWHSLAEHADAVVIEGSPAEWPASGPDAPPERAAFVRRATEPMATPALRTVEEEGTMLVPVASDVFQFSDFAALLQRPTAFAPLMTEFHYGFVPKSLADRLAPIVCPAVPLPSRNHAVQLLQASTIVLLNGQSLRSDGQLAEIALDAIAAGAIPVIYGPCDMTHSIMAHLDRVWSQEELIELQRLLRVPWLRERRWRALFREVCRHHVWTAAERALVLGADPLPEGYDAPLVSAVMISKRPHLAASCLETFRRQTAPAKELILVLNADEAPARLPELREHERLFVVPESWSIGRCLNMAIAEARGSHWAKMDDDDFYSSAYLEELGYYYRATEADAVGRQAVYFHFVGEDRTLARSFVLRRCFREVSQDSFVSGATLSAARFGVPEFSGRVRNAADSEWVHAVRRAGARFVCYDGTSITVYRGVDQSLHTWRMTIGLADDRYQQACMGNMHDRLEAPAPALRN